METPSTKVSTFAVAAAVVTFIVWVVRVALHVEVPGEVQAALAVVVGGLLAYYVPEANPPSSATTAIITQLRAQGKL